MTDDSVLIAAVALVAVVLALAFCGEPDLVDAAVHNLMRSAE